MDYKYKYLKYKSKYLQLKNFYNKYSGGMNKNVNPIVNHFGIDKCFYHLDNLLKIYPDHTVVSVGSGDGKFEYLYHEHKKKEIICIDPKIDHFTKGDMFKEPDYSYVDDYINSDKYKNSSKQLIIILNYCYPFNDPYDMDAIYKLSPDAIFTLYASGIIGTSGSHMFQDYIKKLESDDSVNKTIKIEGYGDGEYDGKYPKYKVCTNEFDSTLQFYVKTLYKDHYMPCNIILMGKNNDYAKSLHTKKKKMKLPNYTHEHIPYSSK
jgi:hypothetical protein